MRSPEMSKLWNLTLGGEVEALSVEHPILGLRQVVLSVEAPSSYLQQSLTSIDSIHELYAK